MRRTSGVRCGAVEGTRTTNPEVQWFTVMPPLTERGRLILCERIEGGRPVAHVAAEMGVSRPTAYRWWRRYQSAAAAGRADRASRPRRTPTRTKRNVERKICNLRRRSKLGPARIGARLGVPASTVYAVLRRHDLHRLAWMDH